LAVMNATPEALREMTDTEVGTLYEEAVTHIARRRGATVESLLGRATMRSERIKQILRVGRLLSDRASNPEGKRTKTLPITAAAKTEVAATGKAVSSRKKSERTRRLRKAQRAGVFSLDSVFSSSMPREWSKEKIEAHKERITKAYAALDALLLKLKTSSTGRFVRSLAVNA